jgi:predicted nucleotide-binding protein
MDTQMPVKKLQQSSIEPTKLIVPHAEAAEKLAARIQKGKELRDRPIAAPDLLEQSRNEFYRWTAYNYELLLQIFNTSSVAVEYRGPSIGRPSSDYFDQELAWYRDDVDYRVQSLESIAERLELFPLATGVTQRPTTQASSRETRKVFIVHGHDHSSREAVARFVDRLDLEAVILHEQPNAGRTIIEKFEFHSDVGFAVVLLTPDDLGATRSNSDSLKGRARQNVIFELGFFFGRLGRDRVCALYTEGVELPSDIQGLVYILLDANGGWQLQLAKELRQAGMAVDLNRVI